MAACGWVCASVRTVTTKVTTVSRVARQPRKWMCCMKLTREQIQILFCERGVWITEACDRCGKLLGAVRWTIKGQPGEWCSAQCRDGIKAPEPKVAASAQSKRRVGSRRSGRSKIHATNADRQRSYRSRLQNGLALRNTPSQAIENALVADVKNGSCVVGSHPAPSGPRNASCAGTPVQEIVSVRSMSLTDAGDVARIC